MSRDNLEALLPLIRSFGRETVHLLGGEPTLNRDFMPILERLLEAGFKVKIFTHGKLPPELVTRLQDVPSREFYLCVNRTDKALTPAIVNVYRKLGYRIQIGATVFKPQQALTHIIEEILTYHLERSFRFGIAVPIWPKRQNSYLRPEIYTTVADELFSFIHKAVAAGLKPSFDCGFPDCFFNETQKAYLAEHEIAFASNCGVIPDVGPGFYAVPCLPLSEFVQPILGTSSWSALRQQLEERLNQASTEFIFEACKDCAARQERKCWGGCAALRITRLNMAE